MCSSYKLFSVPHYMLYHIQYYTVTTCHSRPTPLSAPHRTRPWARASPRRLRPRRPGEPLKSCHTYQGAPYPCQSPLRGARRLPLPLPPVHHLESPLLAHRLLTVNRPLPRPLRVTNQLLPPARLLADQLQHSLSLPPYRSCKLVYRRTFPCTSCVS